MKSYKINLSNKLKEMSFWKKVIILTIVIFFLIIGILTAHYLLLVKQADALILNKDYNKAITIYKQAVYMPDVKTKLSNAEKLQDSENAFKTGMKYFDDKDYRASSKAFQRVIKEDSENYKISIQKISEGNKLYIVAGLITKAQKSASKQDYTTAITYMRTASSINSTNKQINELLVRYQENAKAKLKAEQDARDKLKAEQNERARVQANAQATKRKVAVKNPPYNPSIPMYKQRWIDDPWIDDQVKWAKAHGKW